MPYEFASFEEVLRAILSGNEVAVYSIDHEHLLAPYVKRGWLKKRYAGPWTDDWAVYQMTEEGNKHLPAIIAARLV